MTINDSWGYQQNDKEFKSPDQIISIFSECLSKGGNLLLDIGPKADGSIPAEEINVLKELGKWTGKNAEAIYGTRPGLPEGYFYGPSTLSKDSTMLYLFVHGDPKGQVMLQGIKNKINRIYVAGNGTKLTWKEYLKPYWSNNPGVTFIDVPGSVLDDYMTVIAVILDGKIRSSEISPSSKTIFNAIKLQKKGFYKEHIIGRYFIKSRTCIARSFAFTQRKGPVE